MNEQNQERKPIVRPNDSLQNESQKLSPNDHLMMLLELCKPESMELVRRWVAALMLVPEDQRESIVQAVEKQIVTDFTN